MSKNNTVNQKRIASVADNMTHLLDDAIKKARKEFKQNGEINIDLKFLKEAVGALKVLYELLNGEEDFQETDGIIIKFEKEVEEWSK